MEAKYDRSRTPVHANPPTKTAVATAMGWQDPVSGELLVSIKGLLNDKGEIPVTPPAADTGSSAAVVTPTEPAAVVEPAVPGPAASDAVVEPVVTPDAPAVTEPLAPVAEVEVPPLFEIAYKGKTATVTILDPNKHAYTKWTVDGVEDSEKGNTKEMPKGSVFSTKSAKGEFNGKA